MFLLFFSLILPFCLSSFLFLFKIFHSFFTHSVFPVFFSVCLPSWFIPFNLFFLLSLTFYFFLIFHPYFILSFFLFSLVFIFSHFPFSHFSFLFFFFIFPVQLDSITLTFFFFSAIVLWGHYKEKFLKWTDSGSDSLLWWFEASLSLAFPIRSPPSGTLAPSPMCCGATIQPHLPTERGGGCSRDHQLAQVNQPRWHWPQTSWLRDNYIWRSLNQIRMRKAVNQPDTITSFEVTKTDKILSCVEFASRTWVLNTGLPHSLKVERSYENFHKPKWLSVTLYGKCSELSQTPQITSLGS